MRKPISFAFEDDTGSNGDGGSGGGNVDSGGGTLSGGGDDSSRDEPRELGRGTDPRSLTGESGEPGSGERDASGELWDEHRHSSSRARTADGNWRARRNVGGGGSPGPRRIPRKGAAKDSVSVSEIKFFMVAVHAGIATMTKTPELGLQGDDAHNLAVPLAELASMYNVPMTKEMRVFGMLLIALATVYTPKVMAISQRVKTDRASRQKRPQSATSTAGPMPSSQTDNVSILRPASPLFTADPTKPIQFRPLE